MLVMDIAEWIGNVLILGIAMVIWAVGIFMVMMLMSMLNRFIKTHIIKENE
jgi:hypothetical protein